jgi:hypothetical protein
MNEAVPKPYSIEIDREPGVLRRGNESVADYTNRAIRSFKRFASSYDVATRLAGAIGRMQGTFQSGMMALQKLRSGGQQTVRVVHQHVQVNEGAQAVVAGEMNTGAGGQARDGRGRSRK